MLSVENHATRWIKLPLSMVAVCVAGLALATPPLPNLSPSNTDPEHRVFITIRDRAFAPSSVALQVGQKTRLVFHNTDAELHAVVPVGLLTGLHFHIFGNGAPQFDTHGLKRVIIPSQGTAEIRFIPTRRGIFPYFCDMPGHEMSAAFVVE